MLKVIDSIEVTSFYMVIDAYVPFTFRCQDTTSREPLYWRTGNFKDSLIEIGLNQTSGAICSLTVTLINTINTLRAGNSAPVADSVTVGIPICDISNWPPTRIWDEPCEFEVSVGQDKIHIQLGNLSGIGHAYKTGNLTIGVDSDANLSWVEVENLTNIDIKNWTLSKTGVEQDQYLAP